MDRNPNWSFGMILFSMIIGVILLRSNFSKSFPNVGIVNLLGDMKLLNALVILAWELILL